MLMLYLISAVVFIVLAFLVFRVMVRNDYLNKGSLSPISYSLEFLIFALHANFIYLYMPVDWPALPSFPENIVLNICSKILLILGLLITFMAITGLGFGNTFGQAKNSLKTNGLYRYSRNPQIAGYTLVVIALGLFYPSLYALGWMLLYMIMIGMMIKSEEEFLSQKYGEVYHKYCQEVSRFLKIT